jgi:hypothetical protein
MAKTKKIGKKRKLVKKHNSRRYAKGKKDEIAFLLKTMLNDVHTITYGRQFYDSGHPSLVSHIVSHLLFKESEISMDRPEGAPPRYYNYRDAFIMSLDPSHFTKYEHGIYDPLFDPMVLNASDRQKYTEGMRAFSNSYNIWPNDTSEAIFYMSLWKADRTLKFRGHFLPRYPNDPRAVPARARYMQALQARKDYITSHITHFMEHYEPMFKLFEIENYQRFMTNAIDIKLVELGNWIKILKGLRDARLPY